MTWLGCAGGIEKVVAVCSSALQLAAFAVQVALQAAKKPFDCLRCLGIAKAVLGHDVSGGVTLHPVHWTLSWRNRTTTRSAKAGDSCRNMSKIA